MRRRGELEGAETGSEPSSSPVLRSNVVDVLPEKRAERREAPPALPCLYGDNYNEEEVETSESPAFLSGANKRAANVLRWEIEGLVKRFGVERLVFVTLTYADPLPPVDECEKRYRSFQNGVLKKSFRCGVSVFERSASGRPHFHIVCVGKDEGMDFRTGFDFLAWHQYLKWQKQWLRSGRNDEGAKQKWVAATQIYAESASLELKELWKMFGIKNELYGFGRINTLPIEKAGAIAPYVAKYLSKSFKNASALDFKKRRVRYWGEFQRTASVNHQTLSPYSERWRYGLMYAADRMGFRNYEDFADYLGPRWCYFIGPIVREIPSIVIELMKGGWTGESLGEKVDQKMRFINMDLDRVFQKMID